jgi:hypothetical protein
MDGGRFVPGGIMVRESGNRKALRREKVRIPPRVLELAKWPEQEAEQEWNLESWGGKDTAEEFQPRFKNDAELCVDDFSIEESAEADNAEWRALVYGESLSHPVPADEHGARHATKIVAGIVVSLLLVGAVIFAGQTSFTPPPQRAALKSPQPVKAQTVPASDEILHPALRRTVAPSIAAPAALPDPPPLPAEISPPPARPAQIPHRLRRTLSRFYDDDDPINAPMTLTPDTAPPPQRALPAVPG